jgi:hypothetical protein
MLHSPFEPYLDMLEQSLRLLSPEERAEWREEARQHLVEIARAEEELGLSPEEAAAAAMRQFGNPTQIGRRLAQSVECDPLKARTAVTLFSGPLIVAMLLLIGLAYAYVLTDSPVLFRALQLGGALAFLLAPTLGGWRVGRRLRPGQSSLTVALGLTLIGLLTLPIAGVLLVPARGAPLEGTAMDFRWGLLWFPLTFLSLLLARRAPARRTVKAMK